MKGLKNADENGRRYSLFAFSIPYSNEFDCSPRHMFKWTKKKKNDEKDEKETWRHRPETERFQMRRKREDREHGPRNYGRTDTHDDRPHYRELLHAATRCVSVCVSQFVGIDVRHRAI